MNEKMPTPEKKEKVEMKTEIHVMKDYEINVGDTYPVQVIDGDQKIHCDNRDEMKVGDEIRAEWGEEFDTDIKDGTLIEQYGRTPRFFTENPKMKTEMWIVKEIAKYDPLIANDKYKRLIITRPETPEIKIEK